MVSCYVIAIIKIYTQANIITNMLDAIDCFTSPWISFHVLTPMSGALFLVNSTISLVNVRALSPTAPPSLENSTWSFWLPDLCLLESAFKHLRVPCPLFFPFSEPIPWQQDVTTDIKRRQQLMVPLLLFFPFVDTKLRAKWLKKISLSLWLDNFVYGCISNDIMPKLRAKRSKKIGLSLCLRAKRSKKITFNWFPTPSMRWCLLRWWSVAVLTGIYMIARIIKSICTQYCHMIS